MTFIILTGGIDLSVGSILGTTAVAAMVVSLIPNSRCSPFRRR
jgi:ribose transport system permease protein